MRRTDPLPGRLLIHPFTVVTVRVTTSILVRLGTFGIGNFGGNVTLGESGLLAFLCPRVSLVAHRWRVLRAVAALAHGNDNTFRVEFLQIGYSTRF